MGGGGGGGREDDLKIRHPHSPPARNHMLSNWMNQFRIRPLSPLKNLPFLPPPLLNGTTLSKSMWFNWYARFLRMCCTHYFDFLGGNYLGETKLNIPKIKLSLRSYQTKKKAYVVTLENIQVLNYFAYVHGVPFCKNKKNYIGRRFFKRMKLWPLPPGGLPLTYFITASYFFQISSI